MADEQKQDEAKEEVKEEEVKEEIKQEEPKPEEKKEEPKEEPKKEEPKEEPKKEEPKEEEEEVEVPEKFKKLVEEIEKMAVLDLAELVKILEKKFGVSASAAMVAAPAGGGGGEEGGDAGAEEKTIFNVELKEIGDKKIEVIKAVRDITAQGLKEAKDMVDAAPKVIKEGVKKEEAEEIKKKLETAGATVELK